MMLISYLHAIRHGYVECDSLLVVEYGRHLDLDTTLRDCDLVTAHHLVQE